MSFWLNPNADRPASVAGGVASNTDILGAAAESMRLVDNSNSALEALNEGYEEWRRRFKVGTGQDAPANPLVPDFSREDPRARAMGWLNASDEARIVEQQRTEFAQFINEQAARFPAEAVRDWAQFDPGQHAIGLARAADTDLATKMESRDGWDKFIPAFAGAAGGSLRDPVQLGSLFLGGGAGGARTVLGRILMAAGTEAGVNAATEAALQPSVQEWRAKAGLDSGLDQALTNIAFAGALGGVFGAGGRGLIEVLERQPAGAAARATLPPDVRGALDAAEVLQLTATQKPAGMAFEVFDQLVARADTVIARRAGDMAPQALDAEQVARLVDRVSQPPDTAIARLMDLPDIEIPDLDVARRSELLRSDPALAVRYRVAEERFGAATSRVGDIEQALAGRTVADSLEEIDPASASLLRSIDDELANNPASRRRVELEGKRDGIIETVGRQALEKRDQDFRIGPERELKSAKKSLAAARRERSAVMRTIDERITARDNVSELLRVAGPLPDEVIDKAMVFRAEGQDVPTAVEWAMSDAAGVSRVTPAVDADFDVGTRAPDPEEFDAFGDLDAESDDWAAELEALREVDPDLADQLEADFSAAIDKPAALQRVVSACPL